MNPLGPGPGHLVLIGPMGAGKSTVGALLAQRLRRGFVDTDILVEAEAGRSIRDIFTDSGEPAFRSMERAAVAAALATADPSVLALGGGAVLDAGTRAGLRAHQVIFLDVGLAAAGRRVGLGSARPLLLGDVRGRLKALLDERRPVYTKAADAVVRTDDRTPDQVADEVLEALGLTGESSADRAER